MKKNKKFDAIETEVLQRTYWRLFLLSNLDQNLFIKIMKEDLRLLEELKNKEGIA